jgi:hypothetical protein
LENDKIPIMVLGAVWCPTESARTIAERIRELKIKNGLSRYFEAKWIKVSQAKLQFYLDLIDYFFDSRDLHFRAVIIPDKSKLKDTRGGEKIAKLHDVLCNNMYDFSKNIIERVQLVRSHEIEQLQLTDLLIGSVSYVNRDLSTNPAKVKIAERIMERCRYSLKHSTLLKEEKFNLFRWEASEVIL